MTPVEADLGRRGLDGSGVDCGASNDAANGFDGVGWGGCVVRVDEGDDSATACVAAIMCAVVVGCLWTDGVLPSAI